MGFGKQIFFWVPRIETGGLELQLKINPSQLEAANGLRVGIVPASQGKGDAVRRDERKNLIICPLPYDGEFMEVFYNAWGIIQQFIKADARLPKEVSLPVPRRAGNRGGGAHGAVEDGSGLEEITETSGLDRVEECSTIMPSDIK